MLNQVQHDEMFEIAGVPISERARAVGYLPQRSLPAWAMRVGDLVMLGRIPHRSPHAAPSARDHDAVMRALAACDASAFAERTIDTLSGGELARVLLARVLAGEPDWLLIDEPLNHLDPRHQQSLLALLRGQADAGKGIVIVLHDLNAAAQIADDVLMLREGRIVAQGPAADVLTAARLEQTFDIAFDIFGADNGTPHIVSRPLVGPTPRR